jgi:uncharacterized SAM-binding protein YcdF (DUF218 family)
MMRLLGLGMAGLAAAWLAGFLWFAHAALQEGPASPVADGIVVLTGGADRIAGGLRLLQSGRGRLLLISGVGGGADLRGLLRGSGADPASLDDALISRITLGRTATSTIGNAGETAEWAAARGLQSLIVVTAGYHMQRALAEIARDAPGLTLYPAPVVPPALRDAHTLGTVRLLADEYTKWLISAVGLTRLEAG